MNQIGSIALVRDIKHSIAVGGRFIDNGKRLRIITGEYSGEVLMRTEYQVLEKDIKSCEEAKELLKLVHN